MRLAALSACGAGYAPGVRDTRSPAHPQAPLDPPAPRVIPLLRTSDVDEARLVFNQLYGEATLDQAAGGVVAWSLDAARCGAVNVITGAWSGGARALVARLDRHVCRASVKMTPARQ
ncbi:hypothetical protein [Sorangium sp. So ce233]|uniref:hypothetical protein n=1 Tax=Sorangium sp. So ce233 TaxID=3133290 RepID=UPI003F62377A